MLDSPSVVAMGSLVRADTLGQLQALNTSYLGRLHYGASVGCSTSFESLTVGMWPLSHCQARLEHESMTDSDMPSSHSYFPCNYWTEQNPRRQYGSEYG